MIENLETIKLIVTSKSLYGARRTLAALKKVVPGAFIRRAGLRGIFILELGGNPLELAEKVTRECAESIGRAVAVFFEVPSLFDPIRDSAVSVGIGHTREDESFCFRLNKRGAHGLDRDTPAIEYEIGGAIWKALHEKYGKSPPVDLKDPDVTVIAEVLGANTAVGVLRKAWRNI